MPAPGQLPPLPCAADTRTVDESAGASLPADVKVAQRLGRFVLLHPIGAGGMGSVFAAYDEQLDRKIALKLLHPLESAQGAQLRRVLREAQAMARVSHPNVVQVYEVGETGGHIYIAMEYIDGVTLTTWQQQQQRSWQDTLHSYLQAGQGLLAAHRRGLVHRDFKPDNVLIDREGRARVADFGLARVQGDMRVSTPDAVPGRAAASGAPLTAAGLIAGTPGYMSPEQYLGAAVDSRSDQFSFCVALFEALFQRLPFAGDNTAELAANALAGRRVTAAVNSPVPVAIRAALDRGLAREPAARYPSMAELLAVLEGKTEHDPEATRYTRRRTFAGALSFGALGIVTAVATYVQQDLTIAKLAALAVISWALFVGVAAVGRRSLLTSAFHRGVVSLTLIGLTCWLGIYGLCGLLRLDIKQLIPIALMAMSGLWATVAYQYLSRLWWLVGGTVAGAIVAALRPMHSELILLVVFAAWPFICLYAWDRADIERRLNVPRPPDPTTRLAT